MPKIINIHGHMAAGKSTLSGILNKKLKTYSFVDRAYIKNMLKPAAKEDRRKISKKAVFLILKELMKLKKNILVQEVNPIDIKRKLKPYLKNYKIYSFFLYCSLKTALERDKLRSKKIRPNLVKKTNIRYANSEKIDIPINTDKLSIDKTIKLILKTIKK